MDKVIACVYESYDYDSFKRLSDNRDVTAPRVGKLIASMTEKYILNPIITNEKKEIADGQGRFEARKKMKLPIHYIVAEGATSEDCRRMNKYNTKWTVLDFAKSYAKMGKPAYVRLLEICKETAKPISTILRLCNHASKANAKERDYIMNRFERGELEFSPDDAHIAANVIEKAKEISDALQFSGRTNEAFIVGVKVITETNGYNHNRMLTNCKKCRPTYSQMSRLGDQLVEFERIYNKGARVSNKLFFSDYMRTRGSNVRDYSKDRVYDEKDISTLKVN